MTWLRSLGRLVAGMMVSGSLLAASYQDFDQAPHNYWTRPLTDPFTKLRPQLESQTNLLQQSSEKEIVRALLEQMDVPVSSQMLVFSTTSLQLSLITPSNPRAVYFNEELYVGYVPGGKIEIVSIDPELGGIFYIFDIPRANGRAINIERSTRCMNCHAASETRHVPGLVVKSVIPGQRGGSLISYRDDESGDAIPWDQRLGGWYVTGSAGFTNHMGNSLGRFDDGKIVKVPVMPGERFSFSKYPYGQSHVLPQILLEHQNGFINRLVEATYRTRIIETVNMNGLSASAHAQLDKQALEMVRYILFADAAAFPEAGIEEDEAFVRDFRRNKRPASNGKSLKDLNLKSRLLEHRCSYMVYTDSFRKMPGTLKSKVYEKLREALETNQEASAHLSVVEKKTILQILGETLEGFTTASGK